MGITTALGIVGLALSNPVIIDGRFEDWTQAMEPDGWSIRGSCDDDAVYLMVHHPGPPRVAQQLDEPLQLGLNLDAREHTGCRDGRLRGCELAFTLSPQSGSKKLGGVAARSWAADGTLQKRSPYEFGFMMAPSTASRRHEFRISRDPGLPREIVAVLVAADGTTITRDIVIPAPRTTDPAESDAMMPAVPEDGLRIVSWNIERGGMLKRAGIVGNILEHLDPDVLLIQELEDNQTEADIRNVLNSAGETDQWTIALSPHGSGLRSGVASRRPAQVPPSLQQITRSDRPERTIRAAGLLVDDGQGRSTLVLSLHLKCCGGLNGTEDMTRISEVLSIREAIAETVARHRPDGLVIGGDFNLVASPVPLDVLRMNGQSLLGPDRQGDLIVAPALHPDGSAAYTWYDADSRFTPGQLDFIITGGDLEQVAAFVLDTTDLSASARGDLPPDATEVASDHLPVVVDVIPR